MYADSQCKNLVFSSCSFKTRAYRTEDLKKKEIYHLEDAAIGGHPDARFNLAIEEGRNGRIDWAVKHFIIAASLGCDSSIQDEKPAKKILSWLFVHTKLPWMQRKVHIGRQKRLCCVNEK